MFALGNDTALPLLEEEMDKFPYASNLKASQEFVGQFQRPFGGKPVQHLAGFAAYFGRRIRRLRNIS